MLGHHRSLQILNYEPEENPSSDSEGFLRRDVFFHYKSNKEIEKELGTGIQILLRKIYHKKQDQEKNNITNLNGSLNQNLIETYGNLAINPEIEFEQVVRRYQIIEDRRPETDNREILAIFDSIEIKGKFKGNKLVIADNISVSSRNISQSTKIQINTKYGKLKGSLNVFNSLRNVISEKDSIQTEKSVKDSKEVLK